MAISIQEHVPLAPLTTFGIGGNAQYFVGVKNEDDIREALTWAKKFNLPHVVLAGGSNVLIPDEGLKALVIHMEGDSFSITDGELSADAGCNLLTLIRATSDEGLGGWEGLAGVPGSIGGAVRGNAGAFGVEIKDVLVGVRALHAETLEVRDFSIGECAASYRMSFFKENPEWIITRVVVRLKQVDAAESMQRVNETIAERERRHIQNVQAAGSYFVNPIAPQEIQELFEEEKGMKSREGRVPAGWLIEKAGMKGATYGGAQASMQHPNYIVNTGSARASDVKLLAEQVKDAVEAKFGIRLKEEAVVL